MTSLKRNAIANVAGRSASALVWLAVTPTALRFLGPERFGVWSLFFAFGGYIAEPRPRHDARRRALRRGGSTRAATAAWSSRCCGARYGWRRRRALVVPGVACCCADSSLRLVPRSARPRDRGATGLSVFALSMFVFSITQVLHGALQGQQRLDLSNTFFLCRLAVHATLLIGGLHLGWGLRGAAAAMVAGHGVSGLLAAFAARRLVRQVAACGRARTRDVARAARVRRRGAGEQRVRGRLAQVGKVLLGALGNLSWVTVFELGYRVVAGGAVGAAAHPGRRDPCGRARVGVGRRRRRCAECTRGRAGGSSRSPGSCSPACGSPHPRC